MPHFGDGGLIMTMRKALWAIIWVTGWSLSVAWLCFDWPH